MPVKTAACKLRVNEESAAALAETMGRVNAACNRISQLAWQSKTFRTYDLHNAVYHDIRAEFQLPAQLTVRAIAKVADSYAMDRSMQHVFGTRGAIRYDSRCFTLKNLSSVSLTTVRGRREFVMAHGGKQRAMLAAGTTGQATLVFRDGNYYLHIALKTEPPPPASTEGGVLGVDLGIVELATDSEGKAYSGEMVKTIRCRVKKIRAALQRKGTKSATRHLKTIRRRQSRFVHDVNHCISKALVGTATLRKKALALEDLRGIRERANSLNRAMRWLMGNWAFADLRAKIEYKAAEAGIPVVLVDPRNTSRTCSKCGHCEKANRKSQSHFKCLQCSFEIGADFNAALNIEARAALSGSLSSQPESLRNRDSQGLGTSHAALAAVVS